MINRRIMAVIRAANGGAECSLSTLDHRNVVKVWNPNVESPELKELPSQFLIRTLERFPVDSNLIRSLDQRLDQSSRTLLALRSLLHKQYTAWAINFFIKTRSRGELLRSDRYFCFHPVVPVTEFHFDSKGVSNGLAEALNRSLALQVKAPHSLRRCINFVGQKKTF